MKDLDEILSGEPGAPTLSQLLESAKEAYNRGDQPGPQARVVSRLEVITKRDGADKVAPTLPQGLFRH